MVGTYDRQQAPMIGTDELVLVYNLAQNLDVEERGGFCNGNCCLLYLIPCLTGMAFLT